MPFFEGLNGGQVMEGLLGQVLVVEIEVTVDRGFQVHRVLEVVGSEKLGESSAQAFDHTVCPGRLGFDQAVLNSQRMAERIELMGAGSTLGFLAEDAIGELLSVIGEDFLDLDGCRLGQALKERPCACGILVAFELDKDPAGGSGHGHERVAAGSLARPSAAGI